MGGRRRRRAEIDLEQQLEANTIDGERAGFSLSFPESLPLILDGEVRCPAKLFARIARDACIQYQRKNGCSCLAGQAARSERLAFDVEQLETLRIQQLVRARHRESYLRWGKKWTPTGRPRGRPPRLPEGKK